MIDKAYINLEVLWTERAQHAFDMCNKELKPNDYDAIVTVSGDGLIFEVVNGFLLREDWAEFKDKVTIGCIPGGTGNGLVKSILANSSENYGVFEAAFKIAKGQRQHIDVTEITGEYESKKIYSFLCVMWAIMSDIDINSEVIRCCGSSRFTVWGVYRVCCMRRYRGSFSCNGVRIHNRQEEPSGNDSPLLGDEEQRVPLEYTRNTFLHFVAQNVPWIAKDVNSCPLAKLDDGKNDVTVIATETQAGRCSLVRYLLGLDAGDYFNNTGQLN